MLLIGQYDSPFVRRVGIALRLYGLAFRQEPWSTFGDADRIRPLNPLTRVPTLVLDDGVALTDSHLILTYLDSIVEPARVLWPQPADRAQAIRIAGLGTGLADKAVSLFYEIRLHAPVSEVWMARCQRQIQDTLHVLEHAKSERTGPFWFGDALGHADVAVAGALRFLAEAHATRVSLEAYPALKAFSARLEAMEVFREISQPFIAPA
jgi:glutathione S-transferase